MAIDERCGALDPNTKDGLFYCTLPPGHIPANDHECQYREVDPGLGSPFTVAVVRNWTAA